MEINSAGMGGFDKLIQGAAGDVQAGKNEMSTAFDEYSKAEDKTLAMINLQFQMGEYNAKIEMLSSISKNFTDMLKSLAQKV